MTDEKRQDQPAAFSTVGAGVSVAMQCDYFDAGVCRSCKLMGTPYDSQLSRKLANVRGLLAAWPGAEWLPPMASQAHGFRNKAKMVVGGTIEQPTLGILDASQRGVDLTGCGIVSDGLRAAFAPIAAFISRARIAPYDVPNRRGELKNVQLTEAPDGQLMVRFVLRSLEAIQRMHKHLPTLLSDLPQVALAAVNLLPEHRAALAGDEELALVPNATLPMRVNDIVLHLQPGSFFQTNTEIAAGLYAQAREWVDDLAPASVLDLYCGVGGFALHVARAGRRVRGVELSGPAVEAARLSAAEAGLADVTFEVGDATAITSADVPDVVIVNPPRRGIGDQLCAKLDASGIPAVIYSSCNAVTLARDIAAMPAYRPSQIRLFDMFPQTEHYEIMVLLTRR